MGFGVRFSFTVRKRAGLDHGPTAAPITARYAWGKADMDLSAGDSIEVKGGGFQISGGVRVRF